MITRRSKRWIDEFCFVSQFASSTHTHETQTHTHTANTLLDNIFDFDGEWTTNKSKKRKKVATRRWNCSVHRERCAFSSNAHTDIIHISIVKCEVGINFTFICCLLHGILCVFGVCIVYQFYVRRRYTPIIIFALNVALLLCVAPSACPSISWAVFNDDEKWWWFCGCAFHVANLKCSAQCRAGN